MNYPYENNPLPPDFEEAPKRIVVIIGIILFLLFLFCVEARAGENIMAKEIIDLKIIAQIESSNNPLAVNRETDCVGLYGISQICLKDYNIKHKTHYKRQDLFNPVINKQIAKWYFFVRIPQLLRAINKPVTLVNQIWSYNAGIGRVREGFMPRETANYVVRYRRLASKK